MKMNPVLASLVAACNGHERSDVVQALVTIAADLAVTSPNVKLFRDHFVAEFDKYIVVKSFNSPWKG